MQINCKSYIVKIKNEINISILKLDEVGNLYEFTYLQLSSGLKAIRDDLLEV